MVPGTLAADLTADRGHRLELADIVRAYGAAYAQEHALSRAQRRALHAIATCRTPALGGLRAVCAACGAERLQLLREHVGEHTLRVGAGDGLLALARLGVDLHVAQEAIDDGHPGRGELRFRRLGLVISVLVILASLLGWLIYASSKRELVRRLQNIGFADVQLAASMANSSLGEVGLYVLFLTLSVAVVTLILSRYLAGKRSHLTAVALGLVLVTDMVRANVPWIVYYDYKEKYATNAVIDSLDDRPYEHRVTAVSSPIKGSYFVNDERSFFPGLCYEWLQHQFPYHKVQSLDVIQMPRVHEFDGAYMAALRPTSAAELRLCSRLWELTNTRYVLGMTGFLEQLNQQFDPGKGRFRVHTAFNVVPKHGLQAATKLEHLTTAPEPNGPFALFEFTGALPRARLYSRWQISTNDDQTLERLRAPDFDPAQTVLVAEEVAGITPTSVTNAASGTVNFASYSPRVIRLDAEAPEPSLLLLNDRYHPHWKVSVDGQPARLLRCNYIMRGVSLTPGKHVVEFSFEPPVGPLCVSLVSIVMGAGLCCFVSFANRTAKADVPSTSPGPQPAPSANRQSPIANRQLAAIDTSIPLCESPPPEAPDDEEVHPAISPVTTAVPPRT